MRHRSHQKELLDLGPAYYTAQEYQDCLKKLFTINRLLGFFKHSVRLLRRGQQEKSVLDVGCGGGLFILHLSRYFPQMNFLGVDIAEQAIIEANKALANGAFQGNISFSSQYKLANAVPNSVDVVLTTLVCHHLENDQLVELLKQMYQTARCRVIINDLHRHPLAYGFYYVFSPFFRNRLITHDGLISIQRGFTRREWQALLMKANIPKYRIQWCLPFRWSVVLWKT